MTEFAPSKYQAALFDWMALVAEKGYDDNNKKHVVLKSAAGSGKTTTIVQGSKRIPNDASAIFLAFNKHIVNELSTRLQGTPMMARTIHSMGNAALFAVIKPKLDDRKMQNILRAKIEGADYNRLFKSWEAQHADIIKLSNLARLNLADINNDDVLYSIAIRYDIDTTPNERGFFQVTRAALVESERLAKRANLIDFTDMIYLPIKWDLGFTQFDWVMADECQDFSPVQRAILLKMIDPKSHAIAVGDPSQSIMGFAGADSDSFNAVKLALDATELPLSVCYRCPKSHLKLARELVPEIEDAPNAVDGKLEYVKTTDDLLPRVLGERITLILCRKTAPLISAAIKLIGMGVGAKVRGRDVSKGLTDILKMLGKRGDWRGMDKFGETLQSYEREQIHYLAQRDDNEERIQQLQDKCQALQACYDRYHSPDLDMLCSAIESLFADDDANPAVWLSTVHRAKGLEAENVAVLEYDNMPLTWKGQRPDQAVQELNIKYVATTRAKNALFLVATQPVAAAATLTPEQPAAPVADAKIEPAGTTQTSLFDAIPVNDKTLIVLKDQFTKDEISSAIETLKNMPAAAPEAKRNLFVYQMRSRPAGYGTCPDGRIVELDTQPKADGENINFGTITYDHALTPRDIYKFELLPVDPLPTLPMYPADSWVIDMRNNHHHQVECFEGKDFADYFIGDHRMRSLSDWLFYEPVLPHDPQPLTFKPVGDNPKTVAVHGTAAIATNTDKPVMSEDDRINKCVAQVNNNLNHNNDNVLQQRIVGVYKHNTTGQLRLAVVSKDNTEPRLSTIVGLDGQGVMPPTITREFIKFPWVAREWTLVKSFDAPTEQPAVQPKKRRTKKSAAEPLQQSEVKRHDTELTPADAARVLADKLAAMPEPMQAVMQPSAAPVSQSTQDDVESLFDDFWSEVQTPSTPQTAVKDIAPLNEPATVDTNTQPAVQNPPKRVLERPAQSPFVDASVYQDAKRIEVYKAITKQYAKHHDRFAKTAGAYQIIFSNNEKWLDKLIAAGYTVDNNK